MKKKIPTIEEMLDAGIHFGHQLRRWHPKMEPYIFGVKRDIHIIDLESTHTLLKDACDFLYEQAKLGKKIIFVGTKKQSRDIIELEAKRCGALYVNERWIGGTLTNYKTIRKNLDKLLGFIKGREDGSFDKYTKKERLLIDRDIERMMLVYGGLLSMKDLPHVVFVVDPKREKTAVAEAHSMHLPVVGLVDTNADPTVLDYPVPANDDAIRSVALLVKSIADAVEDGYKEFAEAGQKEKEPVKTDTSVKTEEFKHEEVKKVAPKTEIKEEKKPAKKTAVKSKK